MDHYFAAAEEAIRRATQFGDRLELKKYAQKSPFYFKGKEARALPKLFHTGRFRWIPETPYTDLYGRHYRGGHLGFRPLFQQEVSRTAGSTRSALKPLQWVECMTTDEPWATFETVTRWSWKSQLIAEAV